MNLFLRASIELEHPFAFGAFFCAVFALGSSCSSDPAPGMNLGSGGTTIAAGANGDEESTSTGAQTGSSGGLPPLENTAHSGGTAHSGSGGAAVMMPEESFRSSGCDASSISQLQAPEHSFMLEGKERRYIVRLPQNYSPDQEQPLILALHPNGSGSGYWDGEDTKGPLAARECYKDKAILIVTEAIGGNWRDSSQAEDAWDAQLEEELNYFDHVIEETKSRLCVDEKKIYSIGFSGGGSFSGVLGCRRDDIRAFAAGGAVTYFQPEDCIQTPSAWITIGDGEQSDLRSAFRDYFRDGADCQDTSTAGIPSTCGSYESCRENTQVVYCSHAGGHEVPEFFLSSSWSLFQSLDARLH